MQSLVFILPSYCIIFILACFYLSREKADAMHQVNWVWLITFSEHCLPYFEYICTYCRNLTSLLITQRLKFLPANAFLRSCDHALGIHEIGDHCCFYNCWPLLLLLRLQLNQNSTYQLTTITASIRCITWPLLRPLLTSMWT